MTTETPTPRSEPTPPTMPPPGWRNDFLMQFFSYAHLRPELQAVSKPFCELATFIVTLPSNPERTTALRKLLEAKDCAVRAVVAQS